MYYSYSLSCSAAHKVLLLSALCCVMTSTCLPLHSAPLQNIYQWCGSECNRYERLKASCIGIDIRDNERQGRAKLSMVDEGEEPAEVIEVGRAHPAGNPMLSPLLRWSPPNVTNFTPAELHWVWEPPDTMASSVAGGSCANSVPELLCKHPVYFKQRLNEAGEGGRGGEGWWVLHCIFDFKTCCSVFLCLYCCNSPCCVRLVSFAISDEKEFAWSFFLVLVAQELGTKGTIAPSTPDDDKVDSSNRQKAALYMVRRETYTFGQWILTQTQCWE